MSYAGAQLGPFVDSVIHPYAHNSIGVGLVNYGSVVPVSVAWPTINMAIYIPFAVDQTATIFRVGWFNGGAPSGTREVGVYSQDGTKIVSGAATGSGASVMQWVDVTDTELVPGAYYLAVTSTTTAAFFAVVPAAPMCAALGILTQVTANPLPSTATFAQDQTLAFVPWGLLQMRATM